MDEFFDRVKEQAFKAKGEAAKLTKQVVGKTNNLINQTKISFAISETEGKIKDIYASMGKSLYEKYLEGEAVEEDMVESCEKLDALMTEVYDLREKISELKDSNRCECGEYNKKNAEYCSKCGKKLRDTVYNEQSETYVEVEFESAENEDEDVVVIKPKKPEADDE